jgi:hypothetical protein
MISNTSNSYGGFISTPTWGIVPGTSTPPPPTAPATAIFAASITINPVSAFTKEKKEYETATATRIRATDFVLHFVF